MTQHTGHAADRLNQAQALMGKVQSDLDAAGDFYRSIGVNPDKIAAAIEPLVGAKQREELTALTATATAPKAFRSMA